MKISLAIGLLFFYSQIADAYWTPCSQQPSLANLASECILLEVPMDWSNPGAYANQTITVHAKRIFPSDLTATSTSYALWDIPGGAGVPSGSVEAEAEAVVSQLSPQFTVYLFDKRGTGYSSYFDCPDFSFIDDFDSCMNFIQGSTYIQDRIQTNTYTNTARDWQALIEASGAVEAGQSIYALGHSNGAYLTQRLLLVAPDLLDAVVLDSFLSPDVFRLGNGMGVADRIGLAQLAFCTADTSCASRFDNNNPIQAQYDMNFNILMGDSECGDYFNINTPLNYTTIISSLALTYTTYTFPAAFISRFIRCNEDDKLALSNLFRVLDPNAAPGFTNTSLLVEWNNDWSELWHGLGTPERGCLFTKGAAFASPFAADVTLQMCEKRETAGSSIGYATDEFYLQYPATKIPMLALNGDLDGAVPKAWAEHAAKKYDAINPGNFTYINVPNGGHTPMSNSPVPGTTTSCGQSIAFSFFMSPSFTPDTSCLTHIQPIDWDGTESSTLDQAEIFFGVRDVWGAPAPDPGNGDSTSCDDDNDSDDTIEKDVLIILLVISVVVGGVFALLYFHRRCIKDAAEKSHTLNLNAIAREAQA